MALRAIAPTRRPGRRAHALSAALRKQAHPSTRRRMLRWRFRFATPRAWFGFRPIPRPSPRPRARAPRPARHLAFPDVANNRTIGARCCRADVVRNGPAGAPDIRNSRNVTHSCDLQRESARALRGAVLDQFRRACPGCAAGAATSDRRRATGAPIPFSYPAIQSPLGCPPDETCSTKCERERPSPEPDSGGRCGARQS